MPGKKKLASENSLRRLADLVSSAGIALRPRDETTVSPLGRPENRPAPSSELASELTEEEMFKTAMQGVDRVRWRKKRHISVEPISTIAKDPDLEARRLMDATLGGDFPSAVSEHPEYIEGWIGIAGKRFLPKLRNGLYSVQGQIDLHGLSRAEAQIAVEDFIVRMSRFHSCCIKIIHGRGINSPTESATIKESLQRFLKTRRMSHYVVAYASAPPCDGGVGAIYVLLGCR